MLTKSKYLQGLQCPRLLWYSHNKLLPKITLSDKHKFNQGYEFEKIVHKQFPNAINLKNLTEKENIEQTIKLLKQDNPIIEPIFKINNCLVRADILIKNGSTWDIVEIKSSTKVKPIHIEDLAFQKHIIKNFTTVSRLFVYYINKEYKKQDKITKDIIKIEEVNEQASLIQNIENNIKKFQEIIKLEQYKEIPISQNCNKPYICPLKEECWNTLPKNNVLQLTNWRMYWKLFKEGIKDLKDIPKDIKLSEKDNIIIESIKHIIINKEKIKEFIDSLEYPLYHFDFETFDTAIPIFNTKPYQKIPFQYSLHIEEKDNIQHKEFLSKESDPRLKLIKQMQEDIKNIGDIIVYNKSFEISVIKQLAIDFPEYNFFLESLIPRIKDLADIFRNFYYYNNEQKGSYSIKKVLPAITNKSYKDLEINNGGDASMLYFYSHIKEDLKNKEEIRKNLLKYCELDTYGMVLILQELRKLIS